MHNKIPNWPDCIQKIFLKSILYWQLCIMLYTIIQINTHVHINNMCAQQKYTNGDWQKQMMLDSSKRSRNRRMRRIMLTTVKMSIQIIIVITKMMLQLVRLSMATLLSGLLQNFNKTNMITSNCLITEWCQNRHTAEIKRITAQQQAMLHRETECQECNYNDNTIPWKLLPFFFLFLAHFPKHVSGTYMPCCSWPPAFSHTALHT